MKNKRIAIVGTVGVPASYGGFETLVENLLGPDDNMNDLIVYCSSKSYEKRLENYKNASLYYIPLKANGVQSIPYDIWSLVHAAFSRADRILVLGVSGVIALPFIRLFSKAKIITNIDGLEWKRDKWSTLAKKFLKFSEKLAVKYSDNVIADNQAIADYVVEEYECNAKVIAYGGDHAVGNELKIDNQGYALALCRIEPENNVEIILDGFSQSTTPLKFIGNWDSSEFGRLMKEKYSAFSHIEIIDPIYEIDKLQEFRQSCSFYVHGHSAGGTNPSLVEMMHFGKNILAYDCVYNRATTESKALFFKHAADMVSKINEFNSLENGEAMLAIAQRRYTWAIVKKQYFELME